MELESQIETGFLLGGWWSQLTIMPIILGIVWPAREEEQSFEELLYIPGMITLCSQSMYIHLYIVV